MIHLPPRHERQIRWTPYDHLWLHTPRRDRHCPSCRTGECAHYNCTTADQDTRLASESWQERGTDGTTFRDRQNNAVSVAREIPRPRAAGIERVLTQAPTGEKTDHQTGHGCADRHAAKAVSILVKVQDSIVAQARGRDNIGKHHRKSVETTRIDQSKSISEEAESGITSQSQISPWIRDFLSRRYGAD